MTDPTPPPATPTPPTLDYRQPMPADRSSPLAGLKFVGGIGIAVGVVAIGFVVASQMHGYDGIGVLLLFTPAAVLVVGLALVVPRRTRMLGAGVLASFGVGALILLSLCAR